MSDAEHENISSDERGERATLLAMKQFVLGPQGRRHPGTVMLARKLVGRLPSKDYRAEAGAIFDFVRGDCVEPRVGKSVKACALAMALGHRAAFRTVRGAGRGGRWTCVYPVIGVHEKGGTVWLSADSGEESYVGWDHPEGELHGAKTWVMDPGPAGAELESLHKS